MRERGVRLNPGSPSILSHAIAASALQPLSETQRGERCRAATAIDPKLGTRCESGRALLARDTLRALALLRQSTSTIDASASGRDHANLAQLLLAYGDTAGARREVAIAVEKSAHEYVREDYVARVYFRLGDIERSIDWWHRAVASHSSQVI